MENTSVSSHRQGQHFCDRNTPKNKLYLGSTQFMPKMEFQHQNEPKFTSFRAHLKVIIKPELLGIRKVQLPHKSTQLIVFWQIVSTPQILVPWKVNEYLTKEQNKYNTKANEATVHCIPL